MFLLRSDWFSLLEFNMGHHPHAALTDHSVLIRKYFFLSPILIHQLYQMIQFHCFFTGISSSWSLLVGYTHYGKMINSKIDIIYIMHASWRKEWVEGVERVSRPASEVEKPPAKEGQTPASPGLIWDVKQLPKWGVGSGVAPTPCTWRRAKPTAKIALYIFTSYFSNKLNNGIRFKVAVPPPFCYALPLFFHDSYKKLDPN